MNDVAFSSRSFRLQALEPKNHVVAWLDVSVKLFQGAASGIRLHATCCNCASELFSLRLSTIFRKNSETQEEVKFQE